MGEFSKKERIFWDVLAKLNDIYPDFKFRSIEEASSLTYHFIQNTSMIKRAEINIVKKMTLDEIKVRLSCYLKLIA